MDAKRDHWYKGMCSINSLPVLGRNRVWKDGTEQQDQSLITQEKRLSFMKLNGFWRLISSKVFFKMCIKIFIYSLLLSK